MIWDSEIQKALLDRTYSSVISFYEEKINSNNNEIKDYWALGVAYLLNGDDTTAQLLWSLGLARTEDNADISSASLIEFLDQEASRQYLADDLETSYLIRSQLFNLDTDDLNNIFELIQIKIQLNQFTPQILTEFQVCEKIKHQYNLNHKQFDLENLIISVLSFPGEPTVIFIEMGLKLVANQEKLIQSIKPIIYEFTYQKRILLYTEAVTEICLDVLPNDIDLLKTLLHIKSELKKFKDAFNIIQRLYEKVSHPKDKAITSGLLFSAILQSGDWPKSNIFFEKYKQDLSKIYKTKTQVDPHSAQKLLSQSGLFLYFNDNLIDNRTHHNATAKLLEQTISTSLPQPHSILTNIKAWHGDRKLKIGYIGHTFRAHSVGWLCRWLFQYHDRDRFEIYIYFVNKNQSQQNCQNTFFQTWFAPKINGARELGNDPTKISKLIQQDGIDILVDLDSTTLGLTCHVMALKPAPIQITWLGRDATGLSAVDYFVADSYVLPEYASEHYQENIWRLPHSYIAVEGFEVGVPSIRRNELNIPNEAVVYLSAQTGMKRHPALIRLQMQILHQVPNSYFLIKGIADQNTIQELFTQAALEEGVDPQRLRFLSRDSDEYAHRANLQIADIVLDTYPYNGATTTLETLWAGIPMVTRVGEQFAARNSYTFMKNAGIEEGIAWSDAEYVEWGVRLGRDPKLRQHISWKLKKSRHTAPLWNAAQFTLEMETAYQAMWLKYINSLH